MTVLEDAFQQRTKGVEMKRADEMPPLLEKDLDCCARVCSCDGVEADSDLEDSGSGEVGSLKNFWTRAGWLVLLLMFQSTSSVILARFEMLVKTHPVVIYFLTMLVGAGGNAGGQSTVLIVRKLALLVAKGGKDTPGQGRLSMRKIVFQELSVGMRLALLLSAASFLRCLVFQVRGWECLAICLSMLAIVSTSTLVGAALPVVLDRLGIDPAHAGATIQVIMDISGVSVTCIVSCLVLGIPITDEAAATGVGMPLTRHTAHLASLRGAHRDPSTPLHQ